MLFSIPRSLKILNISRIKCSWEPEVFAPIDNSSTISSVLTAVGCIQFEFKDSIKLKVIDWLKLAKTKKNLKLFITVNNQGMNLGYYSPWLRVRFLQAIGIL